MFPEVYRDLDEKLSNRWHNGRGRVLPDGKDGVVVVLHQSVLTRERALPADFVGGDGVSVTERVYRHKAHFAPGDPSVAQYGF